MQTLHKSLAVPIAIAKQTENTSLFPDFECPDCFALLETYYDHDGNPRYYCENCNHSVSAKDIHGDGNADYDDGRKNDNDISIGFSE
jgi:hypothetical protein